MPDPRPVRNDPQARSKWLRRCRDEATLYTGWPPPPGLVVEFWVVDEQVWSLGGDNANLTCTVGFKDGDGPLIHTVGSVRNVGATAPRRAAD